MQLVVCQLAETLISILNLLCVACTCWPCLMKEQAAQFRHLLIPFISILGLEGGVVGIFALISFSLMFGGLL